MSASDLDLTPAIVEQPSTVQVKSERGERLLLAPGPVPLLLAAPKYPVILADPPWQYEYQNAQGTADNHYSTMSIADLKRLPIGDMAARDGILLMWSTWPMLQEAIELGRAWGFEYKTCGFVWTKMNRSMQGRFAVTDDPANWFFGLGFWTRSNTEFCLLFTKGHPHRCNNDISQLIVAPIREHSRKPDEQYEKIERLVSGPYLELFARRKRPGWYSWGNEIASDIEIIMPKIEVAA